MFLATRMRLRSWLLLALLFSTFFLTVSGAARAAGTVDYLYTTASDSGLRVYEADSGTLLKTVSGSGTCTLLASGYGGKYVYAVEGDYLKAVDTSTDTVSATASYPGASAHVKDLVAGADHNLYVADSDQRAINVYGPDLAQIKSIPVNPASSATRNYQPLFVAVSPDGSRVYAGCVADSSADYSLLIFDAQGGDLLKTVGLHVTDDAGNALPETYHLTALKMSPSGDRLWLGVTRYDASGRMVEGSNLLLAVALPVGDAFDIKSVFVPQVPRDIAFVPDGSLVYVLSSYSGEGAAISYDTRSFQLAGLYTLSGLNLRHGVVSQDSGKVYVSTDQGYSVVSPGDSNVRRVSPADGVDWLLEVGKEVTPTPEPATPTPSPMPATPTATAAPETPTPAPATTPTSVATPTAAIAPASATPAPTVQPTQDSSSGCLKVPVLGLGAIVALGPLLGAVRKRRQP